ncbi:hypothetical protein BVRB_9g217080 [Beta vulgaris subsp. vulgaris]|nr:hypothetical protein BVRB_9g217080 [Beta vulgaris subsp. vulgaris]
MANIQQSSKAKLQIVLNYGNVPIKVFGDIIGSRYVNDRVEFFYHPSGKDVMVTPGKDMPLNMSEVNIPTNVDHLLIDARLWHGSQQIIGGSYSFGIGEPGKSDQHTISGNNTNLFILYFS